MKTDVLTTFQIGVELEMLTCCRRECGIQFAAPADWLASRRRDHKDFHCPNGHPQHFLTKTKEEELQDELNRVRKIAEVERNAAARLHEDTQRLRRQVSAQKGVATRLRNKAIAGICAFCSCVFPNVAEHVRTDHPGESLAEDPE